MHGVCLAAGQFVWNTVLHTDCVILETLIVDDNNSDNDNNIIIAYATIEWGVQCTGLIVPTLS